MSASPAEFDLFVIGAGSGGVRAARWAAQRGARVAVAEQGPLGGTCVNLGCIPKKLFAYAGHHAAEIAGARGFGWSGPAPSFDWATLREGKNAEISRLNGIYERLLVGAGVTLLRGRASIASPGEVEVAGERHRARHILVATGGRVSRLPIPGAELAITSDEAFHLPALPEQAVVVGGGYIAVEFASILAGLGVATTLVHRGEQLLRGFDDEIGPFLAAQMRLHGVDVRLGRQLVAIERAGEGGLLARLDDGAVLSAGQVLMATGRVPNTTGIGLSEAGVELDSRGAVVVDASFQTRVPSIHAIGDCTDKVQLTPVALAEGMAVAERLFGAAGRSGHHELIPTAVFSDPQVATVGLTEATARARHGEIRVFRSEFTPLRDQLAKTGGRVLMKLVVDAASDRVLGVHMVGPEAGEIVQGFAVALTCGATKAQFDATLGIHPTAAEEFVTMRDPVR
jgi:glutathione reductase (NADPH)